MTDAYQWRDFGVRIAIPIESLEQSFAIQEWSRQNLGDRWATTPPSADTQDWYFVDEKDALLFRLRWIR